jgi:deoxyribose-phosphate aldolase
MIHFSEYNYSETDIRERIRKIHLSQSVSSRKEDLRTVLNCIDLTSLNGNDTHEKIRTMCRKAYSFSVLGENIPNVAAVCFYPPFMSTAKDELKGRNIRIASVAGGFPSGQTSLKVKLDEIKYAIDGGADEIDTVISRGTFLEGEYNKVFDELAAQKEVCGNIHLKVILETGELETVANIRKASEIAINAGADFIKTSTGKIIPAATEEAFVVMADTILEYYNKTGEMIGIKPAGGISEPEQAFLYLQLLSEILGEKWMNNNYFRIGASRLADKVLNALVERNELP